MTKKVLTLIIGFNALIVGLSIFQSCGLDYDASICNIWFSHVYQDNDSQSSDYGKIDIELHGNDNCQSAFHRFNLDLIQSCYATTKCVNWQNSIDKESIEISFDKKIIIYNDTIVAGENILSNETIKNATDIVTENDCNVKLIKINIASEIGKMIEFEIGTYIMTFKCSTSDDREFEEIYGYEFKE
jgi:hypothetical protein